MVFYAAFNSISVISRRQLTLFMFSWVSPVLGWVLKCLAQGHSREKTQRIQCGSNPGPLDYESNTFPLSHAGPRNVGKGENAGNHHFLLFPQCFLPSEKEVLLLIYVYFVVCKCFEFGPVLNKMSFFKELIFFSDKSNQDLTHLVFSTCLLSKLLTCNLVFPSAFLKVALQILGRKFYKNTKKSSLYSQSLLIFIHRTPVVERHPITREIKRFKMAQVNTNGKHGLFI